jgi:hypothetical protein
MRQHRVYKHETKGYYAVKVGFAWYGFFFNVFWLIIKSLFFWLSFFIIVLTIFFGFSDGIIGKTLSLYSIKDWALVIVVISMPLLVGFKGNKWVSRNLENKGYQLIQTLPIASKKGAIMQTQNENSDQKPAYATWGKQDSYQPGHRHLKKEKDDEK